MSECARQTVIAHNDPSHVRDRVLRLFEQHHIPANILVSLPSLEGIKRAVAMRMGVALLPRRCAESEIARGELVALAIPEVRMRRQVRLVYRKAGERSHAISVRLSPLTIACVLDPKLTLEKWWQNKKVLAVWEGED